MARMVGAMISLIVRAVHVRRHHRRRRIGAHAAGVRALVAVEDALVILRAGERQRMLAVGENEEAGFLAGEKFLDHDLRAGIAEPAGEHHVDGGFRFRNGLCDHDAFAGGETIGLHHDRRALRADVGLGGRGVVEALVGRGRNIVRLADVLGEAFRSFEPRGRFRRPERS